MKPLILFDLDGTLIDSAPQLAASINRLRQRRSLEPLPYHLLRQHAGMGAKGLLKIALNMSENDPLFVQTKEEFLSDYQEHCTENIKLFSGVEYLLNSIENNEWDWGIVTNKFECFTLPILRELNLLERASVVVCGDATMKLKPNPDNLLLALQKASRKAQECIYVGDDIRDAQAASKIPIDFAAASWGYLGLVPNLGQWSAQYVASSPEDLTEWLNSIFKEPRA